jgi:hypothetical protein
MVCITAFFVFGEGNKMRYIMLLLGIIGTIAQLIALQKRKPKPKGITVQQRMEENLQTLTVEEEAKQ